MSENDQRRLLGLSEDDVEARGSELAVVNGGGGGINSNNKGLRDLLRLPGHRQSLKRVEKEEDRDRDRDRDRREQNRHHHDVDLDSSVEVLGDSAPPEWALLLIGGLIGLTTGLFVAFFNKGVHIIHEWVWAGTPIEGAAWLRIQRLADTWHRILLIPVTGGVIVGMMCGLLEILDQIKQSTASQTQGFDFLAGIFPTIKAIQAAVTLGTGCSLGPEGPSVDIGKSCANGFSLIMEHNRERKIALVAAGAAAGISSGFNAPVAGCFFAIETVLRPLRAENSPPFTTAMIILASVISSTVSNVLQGIKSAFTIPEYDLKSAAELPLYLILGMLCGVISVAMTRLVAWFTKFFKFIQDKFGIPTVVCPALGGFGAGIIALKYPGILYWGFTNVEEILRTGKSASAPGIWLLTQLVVSKVIATALCKGSGLVGGLYAPSLMIGAAAGAVFGGFSAEVINSAIPGNAAVAQPPAYALVGMAATLASVCSVPLTSVLLLFELTKDYRILLPLMAAVGLAIWVPSVTNQAKESDTPDASSSLRGYSPVSHAGDDNEGNWRQVNDGNDLELHVVGDGADLETIDKELLLDNLQVSQAMSKQYCKVLSSAILKDAIKLMHDSQQNCVLVVDKEDFLEGILTYGDIRRCLSQESHDPLKSGLVVVDSNTCLVSSVCTRGMSYRGRVRGILTCYPNTTLAMAKELMEAKGIKQLPVVKRGGDQNRERKRRIVGLLHYDALWQCLSL
ncbi:chloride channel protein [Vigna unguiculata]|uniref:Chloride channel protein n=1 Tax=Vigna unguiculata TaxID=3917 RepID=A0A4D6M3L6_VIGUN|nr:chloride channel protein [Vigna unguiculata]